MEVPVNFDIGNSSGTEPNTSKKIGEYIRDTAFFKSIYFIICRPKL